MRFSTTTGANDFMANTVSIVLPPGESEVCFELLAVDDDIVEHTEEFTLTVEAANVHDRVNGTAIFTILDNDGNVTVLLCPD